MYFLRKAFPTHEFTWSFCFVWITLNYSKIIARQSNDFVIINSVTCDIISLIFFRWRLQKAFFTEESVGSHGCRGISCKDFFPILSCFDCCRTKRVPGTYPLKMSDLQDVTPQYVSNVAVDYWRLNSSSQTAPPFAVMSMSPHEIQRIDEPTGHTVNLSLSPDANQRSDQPGYRVNLALSPDEDQLIDQPGYTGNLSPSPSSTSPVVCQPEHKLYLSPNNVSQVDAMVTSAAVMAINPEQNEPYRDLQIMLGLILRTGFKPTPYQESSPCWQSLSWVGWDDIFFIKL